MKLLNGIDFGVIILYNVILIAVGMYLAKKKIKKASDFTTAGQSLGTFTVAGSIISTCMGASILFSNYQLIHAGGIRAAITSAFWYGAWLILACLSVVSARPGLPPSLITFPNVSAPGHRRSPPGQSFWLACPPAQRSSSPSAQWPRL